MDDSSSAAYLVTPPPPMLTGTDIGDVNAELDLGGRHVNRGGLSRGRKAVKYGESINRAGYNDEEENQGGDGDDYDDLDDELVPVSVSKKLKRGRLRKLGKRERAKIRYFKRCPYSHVQSGCIYGKHGFGFRFRCGFSGNSFQ